MVYNITHNSLPVDVALTSANRRQILVIIRIYIYVCVCVRLSLSLSLYTCLSLSLCVCMSVWCDVYFLDARLRYLFVILTNSKNHITRRG